MRSQAGSPAALRLVVRITDASGVVAVGGVAFLIAMFAAFAAGASSQALAVGRINDLLVMVSYLLAVPSAIALLVLGAWFVVTGYVGRSRGLLPHRVRMGFLAATYVGYPIWGFWFGRHLLSLGGGDVGTRATRAGVVAHARTANDG